MGKTSTELSLAIDAPKSSLLGILRAMVQLGYMAHAHGLYRLGPRSFRLASDMLAVRRFPNLVRPVLHDLHARTQETVFPTGEYHKGGAYGTDVNFPVSSDERNNPKFTGCIDRSA